MENTNVLTSKGRSTVFGPFFKFRQAIVDAMFVQKISNFWWTCGLVLASRYTNFYKILIFGLGVMPQKQNSFRLRVARADPKTFYILTFLGWIFFHRFLTKFLNFSNWLLQRCSWSFNISLVNLICLRTFSSWWYISKFC
jgi:hypothetical protein